MKRSPAKSRDSRNVSKKPSTSKKEQWQNAYMIDIDGVVCVRPNELILGDNKEISALEAGDQSLGLTGLCRVQNKSSRDFAGDLIRLEAQGLLPIEVTPEHPLLVSECIENLPKIRFSKLTWTPAQDLREKKSLTKGHYLVIPRLKGKFEERSVDLKEFATSRAMDACRRQGISRSFPLNSETAWLFGLYVAEGSPIRDSSRGHAISACQFSLGTKEVVLVRKLLDAITRLGYKPRVRTNGSVTTVVLQSRVLSNMFATLCGLEATYKMVPEILLLHEDLGLLNSFLTGYLEGDGSGRSFHSFTATTVSRILALQLQLLCARLGFPLAITESPRMEIGSIMGRKVRLNNQYRLQEILNSGPRRKMKVFDDFILSPIRQVRHIKYSGKVHNIETSDNTYLVSNAVVHNCEHVDNEFPEKMRTAAEIPGAKEWVNSRYCEGSYICFFTARLESHRDVTEEWLKGHGFKYHEVIFGKPRGGNYHYIDKAHVRATTFKGKFTPLVSKNLGIEVFQDSENQ